MQFWWKNLSFVCDFDRKTYFCGFSWKTRSTRFLHEILCGFDGKRNCLVLKANPILQFSQFYFCFGGYNLFFPIWWWTFSFNLSFSDL